MFVTCTTRKKNITYRLFYLAACLFFVEGERKVTYASVITAVKERKKCALLQFIFRFSRSFTFASSAFIHSSSTPIVLWHYLTVTTTIVFLFNLRYQNDMFSYQCSLPCEKYDSELYYIFVLANRQGDQQLMNETKTRTVFPIFRNFLAQSSFVI